MSELKMGARRRAQELAGAARPEQTQRPFATTMDFKPVDQARGMALAALEPAVASGLIPMIEWSGALEHEAPPEDIKKFYPPEQQAAWSQPVSLRLAVFEDERSGAAVWLVESPSAEGQPARLELWLARPGEAEWDHYRSLSSVPDGMGYLSQLSDPNFVASESARLERDELNKTANPAPGRDQAPRV